MLNRLLLFVLAAEVTTHRVIPALTGDALNIKRIIFRTHSRYPWDYRHISGYNYVFIRIRVSVRSGVIFLKLFPPAFGINYVFLQVFRFSLHLVYVFNVFCVRCTLLCIKIRDYCSMEVAPRRMYPQQVDIDKRGFEENFFQIDRRVGRRDIIALQMHPLNKRYIIIIQ